MYPAVGSSVKTENKSYKYGTNLFYPASAHLCAGRRIAYQTTLVEDYLEQFEDKVSSDSNRESFYLLE